MQYVSFQRSEVGIRKSFRSQVPDKRFGIFILICSFGLGMYCSSCSSPSSKPYNHDLVVTYAELTLLYEKEKMTNKIIDSLYQIKVKDFFAAHGYEQEKFKQVIDELSQHPEAWKMFIQDVTMAMDSLKAAGK
jgi:ABC-type multidrug transport system fused ATPase/permease subunit